MCDIRKTLHCIKQRVHHRCPPAGIQVSAEQIRLLAHQHVTDQPFSIRVVYRHLYKPEAALDTGVSRKDKRHAIGIDQF